MKKILYSVVLLFSTSCSDFLEPQSQTEYVPRDLNSLNELLLGNAYLDPNNTSQVSFSLHEFFSDDWSVTSIDGNNVSNQTEYTRLKPFYAWHPEMFRLAVENNTSHWNVWKDVYQKILGCNAVLDYVDKLNGLENDRNYIKGQALALRAFYYFQLVNLFGEPYNYNKKALSVPLKLNSNLELDYPKRATVEEVYAQIDKDLLDAENCYLNLPSSTQFYQDGRVTLPMIQLSKARVALFKEDYPKVIEYSQKVIQNWGLTLLDLNNVTMPISPTYQYYNFVHIENPEAIWLFGNYSDFQRFTNTVLRRATGTVRMFNAAPSLLDSYEVGDLRRSHYILREPSNVNFWIPSGKVNITPSNLLAVPSVFGRSLRLSEAYVMLSEAYYYTGKSNDAVRVLEDLRKKRFEISAGLAYKVSSEKTSGTALLTFIREERRREMCYEGLRWFDQRRYGMDSFSRVWKEEGVETVFVMEKNDPAFTLPIPYDAMEKNPNLIQNTLSNPKY